MRTAILLISAVAGMAATNSPTYLFQGAFTTDNQVELVDITVSSSEQVTIRSYGYAGGTVNATTIPAGGFAPVAVLFDPSGNEIASDAGGHCAITAADAATGNCDDAYIQQTLEPGTYTLALAEYDNEPADSFFSDGFTQSGNPGFTCAEFEATGNLCDVTTAVGAARTGNYAVAVTADNAVSVTNVDGTMAYMVGDVAPYTTDTAPNFGDGSLNIQDLVQELFAVNNIPGFQPAACSDRYDAMDLYPADTATTRGGDGALDIRDLILELFRVNNLDMSRPIRTTMNGVCRFGSGSSAQGVTEISRSRDFALKSQVEMRASLELGDAVESGGGQESIPVYLEARQALDGVGVTFAVGDGKSALRFVAAAQTPPTLAQDGPGVVAAAWLEGVSVPAGGRLLLGYVTGPAGALANLTVYGVSATAAQSLNHAAPELRLIP